MNILFNQGLMLQEKGDLTGAMGIYRQVLDIHPDHVQALSMAGIIAVSTGSPELAVAFFRRSAELQPNNVAAFLNWGKALSDAGNLSEALEVLRRVVEMNPLHYLAYVECGNVFKKMRRHQDAIQCYNHALHINELCVEAHFNKGNAFRELKNHEAAIESYRKAIHISPNHHQLYSNYGNSLVDLRQYRQAISSFEKALSLNPDSEFHLGKLIHTKLQISDWTDIEVLVAELKKKIEEGKKVSNPFHVLGIISSPILQHKASKIFALRHPNCESQLGDIRMRPEVDRIRIAYFSADFHNHATAYLLTELIEKHDRTQFEVIGFSFGPRVKDEMRQRLENAFDRFYCVEETSDKDIALMSREIGVDIAIDLKGYTQDYRSGIFAFRAAPLQVSYLGYPGTMGVDYMDYLIADSVLIPKEQQAQYSEKIIYLPHSYQVNDSTRMIAEECPSREAMGLPHNSFIFFCFNNNYKITPDTFSVWMRILKRVGNSVLWLLKDSSEAEHNLRDAATRSGVDPSRLIFASRVPLPQHLARHRLADLFLDTLPYNAHTTASDALWAGLPLMTCVGESFPGRVAGSLLNALNMPELIVSSMSEYEELAVGLATNVERYREVREKLANNLHRAPLFNTELFARNLENAFIKIYERYRAGSPVDHISISQ